jgi:hypothetical protein
VVTKISTYIQMLGWGLDAEWVNIARALLKNTDSGSRSAVHYEWDMITERSPFAIRAHCDLCGRNPFSRQEHIVDMERS